MRTGRSLVALVAAVVSLAACGGSTERALSEPPAPAPTAAATSASAPEPYGHHPPQPRARAAKSSPSVTASAPAQPVTRTSTRTVSSPAPTAAHHAAADPARSACSGVAGRTTTIREVSVDRFSPSTVTISRCDSVRAVYADTTGVPHTWTGPGWDSGGMNAGSNSSYTYRFTSVGSFHFVCSYHQSLGMTGTVTVS